MKIETEISFSEINGQVLGLYLLFREGELAAKTRHFRSPDGFAVNIDVDERNVPIGLELVFLPPELQCKWGGLEAAMTHE